ncbi:hypothetical protein NDU88_003212 [Pleurodeles waltl]|uniref:Uncharacterized protein n=1 Tax=Pleurodeles waltl TaxID=8319 RepID=A0AAV7W4P2_PLEWA|nr:hypothetical protein NDU88_003212 [Pleurodeles waltl]
MCCIKTPGEAGLQSGTWAARGLSKLQRGLAHTSGRWELHFPAALVIPRYSPTLRFAARGFHLGLPRKHNNDESAAPALSRELCFRPPRPPDEETTGRGGD